MVSTGINKPIRRFLFLASNHPRVLCTDVLTVDNANGVKSIDVAFDTNLPSDWRKEGKSPSGVRIQEVVRFDFRNGFPLVPPEISLREDFPRTFPHMQPYVIDERPVPCIYDGNLAELLHRFGIPGILNQTAKWLENAALDMLIDPKQGWEPVRRDSLKDFVFADAHKLQNLVNRRGGYRYLETYSLKFYSANEIEFVANQILDKPFQVNLNSIGQIFYENKLLDDNQIGFSNSLALVVWPGKYPSGKLIINEAYYPENVDCVDSLKKRAEQYGCKSELITGLSRLNKCLKEVASSTFSTITIVLLARRPFNLIGSSSQIELCPYVVDVSAPDINFDSGKTVVRPAAHQHVQSRTLLSQISGNAQVSKNRDWTLVGAGSLGSKIAIHLARAGNSPKTVIDKAMMMPHNAARHALIPITNGLGGCFIHHKARLLSLSLKDLDQTATPIVDDVTTTVLDQKKARRVCSKTHWAVVNSTASLAVREALGMSEYIQKRVIETSLFSGGRIGVVTIEGSDRKPNTIDLMADFYAIVHENSDLSSVFSENDDSVSREATGHGCGSLTMVMSDGRLSIFAAGMAEYLLKLQREGFPDYDGEILIGRLTKDGLGLQWQTHRVPKVEVAKTGKRSYWQVRIHERAAYKIQKQVECWQGVETGGVLMGRFSEASRVAHVVDVLEAPDDSRRSANEFVLGTKGLKSRIRNYSETVGFSLFCLGTWHNHLSESGPSEKDRETAKLVSETRLSPTIFLIAKPTGFEAIIEDPSIQ